METKAKQASDNYLINCSVIMFQYISFFFTFHLL